MEKSNMVQKNVLTLEKTGTLLKAHLKLEGTKFTNFEDVLSFCNKMFVLTYYFKNELDVEQISFMLEDAPFVVDRSIFKEFPYFED